MFDLINYALAQDTIQTTIKQPSTWTSMIPLVLIMVVFYFLLIRPQQKKMKDHQLMVKSIVIGQEVITNGGIYGNVINIDHDKSIIDLQIAESVIIKIRQEMVSEIVQDKSLIALNNSKVNVMKPKKFKAKSINKK